MGFHHNFFTWLVGVFWYQQLHVIQKSRQESVSTEEEDCWNLAPSLRLAGRCYQTTTVNSRWWQLKYLFMFIPTWGFMIQFDEHIFQMGWFNHQAELFFEDLHTSFGHFFVYLLELWYLLIFTSWRRSWKTLCCAGVGKLNLTDAVMLMTFHCVQRSNCYPKLMNSLWEYVFLFTIPHHHLIFLRIIFSLQLPEVLGVSLLKSSTWKLIEVWTSTASVSWGWLGISFQLCQCRYVNCVFVNPKKKEIMNSKFEWSSKWSNDCCLPWSFGNFESKVGVYSCHEFPKVILQQRGSIL